MMLGTLKNTDNVARKRRRVFSDTRHSEDLLTRPSWTDARTALSQINKGKASGNRIALWLRTILQSYLFQLGCFVQLHAGKVLFVGLLALCTFCVGLKSATILTDVEKLWVEEGGRLEHELNYIRETLGEGSGSTNQMLIQTPKVQGSNLLYANALLAHLKAVQVASQVSVDMFDIKWKLKDLCYSPSFPSYDTHYIDIILENIFPCAIITPLDCFWEGSKLLGPEHPVIIPGLGTSVQWSNLHPIKLINMMRDMGSFNFEFDRIEDFMKRAGISSAYQEKPCLNPEDPECPKTAPNKYSKAPADIGSEVTGGCYGFAPKYMHWPEELVIGGAVKNKTGHIMRAEALQTIIQLMGEKDMYDFWADHYKVHNLDWSPRKARQILESWQRSFKREMLRLESSSSNITKHHDMNAFTTTSLKDILRDFSQTNAIRIAVGYILMLGYACVSLMRWSDPVNSQSGIGIAGVLLVAVSVAAGLGFCSIVGLLFNASTTQIVPFLALGLGVDDMFLLAHTYAENSQSDIPHEEQTGECLKRTGVSVLLTSLSNACAFFAAANIPIPALRAFALQIAILVLFNVASMLLIYPAIVSLDLRRRQANMVDVFCCFPSGMKDRVVSLSSNEDARTSKSKFKSSQVIPHSEPPKHTCITHALPPDRNHIVTVLAEEKEPAPPVQCWSITENGKQNNGASVESLASVPNSASTRDLLKLNNNKKNFAKQFIEVYVKTRRQIYSWSLSSFASEKYGPFLQKSSVKAAALIMFILVISISIYGMLQVTDGLDLTDIVPRDTDEFQFLKAQSDYFGFYNMFAVTQGNFEYPVNQKLLYEYHDAFVRVDRIIKDDDGGLPDFWLGMMRDWLLELQKSFDQDWKDGCINQERWFGNASDNGVLAYKLLVQTGHVDNPIDKSLLLTARLVNEEDIINPKAFYNYLTAWATNDALAYSASQAYLMPEPREWFHVPQDVELKIPKSQPLVYAQMPFYLNNLGKTAEVTNMIKQVRSVCKKFETLGLPNFPTGIPFTFWEQYIGLRFYLMLSLICVLVVVFVVIMVILFNPWAAAVVVIVLAAMVVQLFGFMGFAAIRLSAVPAVILIVAVGIGVEFTAHVTLGFLTSIGNRNRRMCMTLEHTFAPVIHGAISTLLGLIMLGFSEFDFIVRYFFYVLLALVLIGVFNGLFVLPVLLSLIGPFAEVIPKDDPNRIATPSPEPSPVPVRHRSKSGKSHKRVYPHGNSELSLTTITEEPPSLQSSHEIVIQPEVIVQTTTSPQTVNNNRTSSSSNNNSQQSSTNNSPSSGNSNPNIASSTSSSSSSLNSQETNNSQSVQHSVTTKVTATVKVEVHTPLPGAVEKEHSHRRKRRKDPPPYTP